MNKLKLHLEDLSVESFDTERMEKAKGTVVGEQLCTCASCPGQATCDYTCDDATCPYTCDDNTCVGSCQTCSPSCWDTCRPRQCYGTGTSA
jgi:hypothetical protein